MKRPRTSSPRKGFTIVELLVATAITAVMAALLITITAGVMGVWNRSRGNLSISNQAKLALDQLAADLSSAILRRDENTWFAATISGPQSGTGDAGISDASYPLLGSKPGSETLSLFFGDISRISPIEDYRFGHLGVWLRFFAFEADSNVSSSSAPASPPAAQNQRNLNLSGPRAVSYQIARIPLARGGTANTARYFLFRSSGRPGRSVPYDASLPTSAPLVVDPDRNTLGVGYDIVGNNAYNGAGGVPGDSEPGSIRRPDRTQIIAQDVVDFGVKVFTRDSSGELVERFPVDRTVGPTAARWALLANSGSSVPRSPATAPYGLPQTPVYAYPVVVDVMIRVLSEEGAAVIQGLENGTIAIPGGANGFDQFWWEMVREHSEVYSRRIEIVAHVEL